MKRFRPRRCLIFPVLLPALILCLCCAAFAEGQPETADVSSQIYQCGGFPGGLAPRAAWTAEAEQAVTETLESIGGRVELSSYHMTYDDVRAMYTEICNEHPELFYVDGTFLYSLDGDFVETILPQYTVYDEDDNAAKIAEMQTELERAVSRAVTQAKRASAKTLQVLLVNDYLCDHADYDLTYTRYDAYSALVDGSAVCQGYAEAFKLVMNRLGISCCLVSSDSMNHAWNMVLLDGNWYHVDVTWDDTSATYHDYFLCSDGALSEHSDWTAVHEASDTTYDSFFWKGCCSAIPVFSNAAYVITTAANTNTVTRWSAAGESSPVVTFEARWVVGEDPNDPSNGYYEGYFGSMTVVGNLLYYVVPDGVMSVPVTGGTPARAMTVESGNGSIYVSSFSGKTLTYQLGTDYNVLTEKRQWSAGECSAHHYTGGVNGSCVDCGESVDIAGLNTLTLPADLAEIGAESFDSTRAQVIIVPGDCVNAGLIDSGAFDGASMLKYLFLPEALEGSLTLSLDGVVFIYYQ